MGMPDQLRRISNLNIFGDSDITPQYREPFTVPENDYVHQWKEWWNHRSKRVTSPILSPTHQSQIDVVDNNINHINDQDNMDQDIIDETLGTTDNTTNNSYFTPPISPLISVTSISPPQPMLPLSDHQQQVSEQHQEEFNCHADQDNELQLLPSPSITTTASVKQSGTKHSPFIIIEDDDDDDDDNTEQETIHMSEFKSRALKVIDQLLVYPKKLNLERKDKEITRSVTLSREFKEASTEKEKSLYTQAIEPQLETLEFNFLSEYHQVINSLQEQYEDYMQALQNKYKKEALEVLETPVMKQMYKENKNIGD